MGKIEDEARRERLKRALRENLKRRKAQTRGRAGPRTDPDSAADETPDRSGPSRRDDGRRDDG